MIEKFAPNQAANPANFSIITLVQARYCRRNEARPGTFRPDASVPRPAALLGHRLHGSGCGCALRVPLGGRNAAVPRSSRAAPAGHRRRHRILLRLHDGLNVSPMRKGPRREAARPLSIGEPRPRERDGRHETSVEFRRVHSTKCHWRLRVEPTPVRRDPFRGPIPASPARGHDVVRRSLVNVGRASGAAETHEDRNHCEDVAHAFKYAPGPSATIQCAWISPLSTGSRTAPVTVPGGPARCLAASVSCRSHTHGCRDRPGAPAGSRGNAWRARNPRTRSQ